MIIIHKMAYCCYVDNVRNAKSLYISQQINDVIVILWLQQNGIATLFWRNDGVIITLCVRRGWYTEPRYKKTGIIMSNSMWNYLIIVYIYNYYTHTVQMSINAINNVPEPGQNLAGAGIMQG